MVVNNACNLACRHCYLQVDRLTGPELTLEERFRLVESVFDQKTELVCLSGKEVFLGNRGLEMLRLLSAAKRARNARTRIGLITNGTLIERHRETILASELDYLDISVDGVEVDHDYNRGAGAFAAMRPNLEWAVNHLGERFFVNMTLNRRNSPRLVDAVAAFHHLGVQTVGCGFYHPLPYTDPDLALSDANHDAIFETLHDLELIPTHGPLTVLLEVDVQSVPAMLAFMRSDWFLSEELSVDERGSFYVERTLSNGVRVQVRFAPLPLIIYKSVRISFEGNYIAAEDTVDAKRYAERSLGNVRNFDFDLTRLHRSALRSPRVAVLLRRYFDTILPRLQEAYLAQVKAAPASVFVGELVPA